MSDNNFDDLYPDLSGIFDIDEKDIPKVPIKKTETDKTPAPYTKRPSRPQQRSSAKHQPQQRILTADRPYSQMTPEEKKQKRKENHELRVKKAKTRLILILSAALLIIVGVLVIRGVIVNSKKPVVNITKAVVEPMERSYQSEATIIKNPFGTYAVLIDNDYDVHYLEKKQRTEVRTADDTIFNGIVDKIQEEDQEGDFFEKIISSLLPERPETSVYTVYISINDPEGILKDGEKVNTKIFTKSIDKALTVPTEAIRNDNGQSYVWMYHSIKKVIIKQDISIGITADNKTEITAGLNKGDTIITTFSCNESDVYNGMKVKTE